MTHSKLDERIRSILDEYKCDQHGFICEESTIDPDKLTKALLEAFEQSLDTIIGEDELWEVDGRELPMRKHGRNNRNILRQEQRNEAIKVIRGNDE